MFGVALKRFSDLDGQFAGGRQHQNLRCLLFFVELTQHWQRKGGRLASTGLCGAEQVSTRQ